MRAVTTRRAAPCAAARNCSAIRHSICLARVWHGVRCGGAHGSTRWCARPRRQTHAEQRRGALVSCAVCRVARLRATAARRTLNATRHEHWTGLSGRELADARLLDAIQRDHAHVHCRRALLRVGVQRHDGVWPVRARARCSLAQDTTERNTGMHRPTMKNVCKIVCSAIHSSTLSATSRSVQSRCLVSLGVRA